MESSARLHVNDQPDHAVDQRHEPHDSGLQRSGPLDRRQDAADRLAQQHVGVGGARVRRGVRRSPSASPSAGVEIGDQREAASAPRARSRARGRSRRSCSTRARRPPCRAAVRTDRGPTTSRCARPASSSAAQPPSAARSRSHTARRYRFIAARKRLTATLTRPPTFTPPSQISIRRPRCGSGSAAFQPPPDSAGGSGGGGRR